MPWKATWIPGFGHWQYRFKLASCWDGKRSDATAVAVGRVGVPGLSSATHGTRCLRRSEDPRHPSGMALKKTACGAGGRSHSGWYHCGIRGVRGLSGADTRIYLEFGVRRVQCRHGGQVKREHLSFLADHPVYTKRFAFYAGQHCVSATIKDVAQELPLDWHAVRELDKQYMRAQLRRIGTPGPKAVGSDKRTDCAANNICD